MANLRAGKVFMKFDDGTSGWVPSNRVMAAKKDGGEIANVRLRSPGGQERDVSGASAARLIGAGAQEVPAGQEQGGASLASAVGSNLRGAIGGAVRGASLMLPGGAGVPRRLGTLLAGGTIGDVAARPIEGQPQDFGSSLGYGAVNAALGAPFELAAIYGLKAAPGMAASALRPTKSQQVAAEAVAARQGQTRPVADYERLGKQMLAEDVLPNKAGTGTAQLRSKMDADNELVESIIRQAGQQGMRITAPQLARSPEVREVMKEIAMEAGHSKESIAYARGYLRDFMAARATGGAPARPTGVLNSRGQMVVRPKQPRVPNQLTPETANTQKRVWREESGPVLRARQKDNPVGPQQNIDARLADALARAAKARFDAIPIRLPDPENPGQTVGVREANERIERRVPLEDALKDFSRRPRPTALESVGRIAKGHLLAPESEAYIARMMARPEFQRVTDIPRLLQQLLAAKVGGVRGSKL